ncbi:Bifunctional homocysteine S-methyltransferase/5,10-methylenetetrahydrofolate reductase [Salisediminibacterium beveridgei]|uniref:Bifunctional homocysteine S-methyltransferase/5,10-methylenetetrahydrofolate reductase n=1 Tax=Salisediminibacterium beveridgei TaxID=632773 RepID=A0A1D7QYU9_9BACI|nr:Bifunctional homocysteine S-methyltransferase/5,10-methylenetetrahydrofolate reductase [Salisediminibacterium beveridgei]
MSIVGLKEELNHRVLVGDGAMGTLLYQEGIEGCFEELNASAPETIEQVHRRYINAGADVIQTNTYAANHVKLRRYQQEHRVREFNEQAVKIARKAAGNNAFVVGTIGGIKAFFSDRGFGRRDEGESCGTSGCPCRDGHRRLFAGDLLRSG